MYDKKNPKTIQSLFSSIAPQYDRANAIISLGFHQIWNKTLVKKVNEVTQIKTLLDLCSGTGEIAFNHLKKFKEPQTAHLLDFCGPMLKEAKSKAKKYSLDYHQIHYIEGDAQSLPFNDGSIDAVTVAYGVRNIEEPEKFAAEAFRVLRPGGCLGILELTRPSNPLLYQLHKAYLRTFLPILGKLAATNQEAYEYLSSSVNKFLSPTELAAILLNKGFSNIKIYPLTGGISTILIAMKS